MAIRDAMESALAGECVRRRCAWFAVPWALDRPITSTADGRVGYYRSLAAARRRAGRCNGATVFRVANRKNWWAEPF